MEFVIERDQLLHGVQNVQRAISPRSTLPILTGILFEVAESLKLSATDLEIGIENVLEAKINSEGKVVLPAQYLANIIRELPSAPVYFKKKENSQTVNIVCENSEFNIHGFDPEEFPVLPEIESEVTYNFNPDLLQDMIEKVKIAISSDETQPALTGSLLNLEGDQLEMVSTTGYRLAYKKESLEDGATESIKAIIPQKTLIELARLISTDQEKEVKVTATSNQMLFAFENITIISRLIEGQFPNFKPVIPKEYNTRVLCDRNQLLQAVKRASLVARNDSNIINLEFKTDRLVITVSESEIGTAYEEVKIEQQGPGLEMSINATYLLDVLKVTREENVVLETTGPLSPCVVKPDSEEDYIYIIMPVRH
ncbi:MAG: DNA polymerase III subunit beta [Halanaerobium sp.]|nr:DNA polymerase III subunit beta [Halanaerobium sp.]